MALVAGGFDLYVTLIDAGGDTATLKYALVAADAAAAATATATILTRLNLVTDAVVKAYSIIERFIEDALVLPATNVQIENRAKVVSLLDGDPTKTATVYIPAPVTGIFQGGPGTPAFNIVDLLDTDLLNYMDTWMVTGALATLSDGEFLADNTLLAGERTHRRSAHG